MLKIITFKHTKYLSRAALSALSSTAYAVPLYSRQNNVWMWRNVQQLSNRYVYPLFQVCFVGFVGLVFNPYLKERKSRKLKQA